MKHNPTNQHISSNFPQPNKLSQDFYDSSIEKHDRFNFEVKLDYHLETNVPKNQYKVSYYCFLPQALQINSQTYTHSEFFADINNYIRFKTPLMALSGLLDSENSLSPIYKIKARIKLKNCSLSVLNKVVNSSLR